MLTNQSHFYDKLKLFARHGVTKDPTQYQGESHGPWYYQQLKLGYNYRLSDMHAALGLSQLKKLDVFIQKRSELAKVYDEGLADLPLKLPIVQPQSKSAWHLYMVELTQHDRQDVYQQLQNKGVGVNVHYIPIHLQPFYQQLGFKQGDFPLSEHFYQNALTLPLFPSLTDAEQKKVIDTLHEVLL